MKDTQELQQALAKLKDQYIAIKQYGRPTKYFTTEDARISTCLVNFHNSAGQSGFITHTGLLQLADKGAAVVGKQKYSLFKRN